MGRALDAESEQDKMSMSGAYILALGYKPNQEINNVISRKVPSTHHGMPMGLV